MNHVNRFVGMGGYYANEPGHRCDPGLNGKTGAGRRMSSITEARREGQAEPAPCRSCGAPLRDTFVDLGLSPLCQTQIAAEDLDRPENFYPLHVRFCRSCWLVQIGEYVAPDVIFGSHYPYFSSYSDSWVEHARQYVQHLVDDFGLGANSFLVEIASNDGYLLQHAVRAGIPCLGIEPTASTASAALAKGIPTLQEFFGTRLAGRVAGEHRRADVIAGNNVLAHVPDLNDFLDAALADLDEHDA